jgi:hypothetical protein
MNIFKQLDGHHQVALQKIGKPAFEMGFAH